MDHPDCVFCKIISGEIPSHKIYENDLIIAFLDIFPSHHAQALVVTKQHMTSKFSQTDPDTLNGLVVAAQKIAQTIESRLEGIERCVMVIEGFEVDHLHLKLFPARGRHESVTHSGERSPEENLAELNKSLLP